MAAQRSNIINRSPFVVTVRSDARLERQFSYTQRKSAEAYVEELAARGVKARLRQLETAFQLRVRRKGVPEQFITFDTFAEAEQARLRIESDLSVSIVRDYAQAAQTTLRALLTRYREEVVPGHKGASVERTRINRLLRDEAFVDKPLAALSTEDLQDFITDRLTEVAPATVDRELDVISQTLRYADDVWKIAPVESPFKGLRRPKYFNERDRRISPSEELAILAAARADENLFIEPAIILALETAMRRGELLKVTAADVNFELRHVVARDTKNGRTRNVPISTRATQVLKALIDAQSAEDRLNDEPLLALTPNAHKKAFFNRVIPKSGVVDLHFHDLRHEAISRMAESGRFQLIELQAISGHRDMRMLQRYAHLCSGQLAAKLDDMKLGTTTRYVHRGRTRTSFKPEPLSDGTLCPGPEAAIRKASCAVAHGTDIRSSIPEPQNAVATAGGPMLPASPSVGGQVINFADFARAVRSA